ncbi:ABC transporter substrate-binding protein [Bradyrhizobium lupini]|uniref:ABC transporter substrate-binding protein n=1 Tax=Rhizobium lupini TaxID=136996 RepID=UPI000FFB6D66
MTRSTFAKAFFYSVAIFAGTSAAQAAPSGELVVLQWIPGSELDAFRKVQAAFTQKYPEVKLREVTITWSGDPRGSLRAALMGGEAADIMVNTWPSFRAELVEGGLLRSLDDEYQTLGWDKKLDPFWKELGSTGGSFYGLPYNFGHRSGLWYRTQTLNDAGVSTFPQDWTSLLDSFKNLKAKSVTPLIVPAKFWAHTEIFESLLLRVGGTDLSRKLATHEIKWTDDQSSLHCASSARCSRLDAAIRLRQCSELTGTMQRTKS